MSPEIHENNYNCKIVNDSGLKSMNGPSISVSHPINNEPGDDVSPGV